MAATLVRGVPNSPPDPRFTRLFLTHDLAGAIAPVAVTLFVFNIVSFGARINTSLQSFQKRYAIVVARDGKPESIPDIVSTITLKRLYCTPLTANSNPLISRN